MKPHKKPSILDFFAPLARRPQAQVNADSAPPSQVESKADPTPTGSSQKSLVSSNKKASPAAPPAPTNTQIVSPEAQPPTTSQTSVNSGASKRIVSNGKQVVLNSDSDSDSLPELDFGVLTTSFKTVTPATRSKRTAEYEDDGLRKPEKRTKSQSKHFDQVVQTAKKSRELEQRIAEHKAEFEHDLVGVSNENFVFNEDALGQVVQNEEDPDQAHRLFLAMQRTNATHVERVYHLFDNSQTSQDTPRTFPVHSLPEHRWTTSFRDAATRDQAFYTGFAQQVFRLQELPQELASWMIDEICDSRSDALTSKYLEILETNDQYLRNLLDRERLHEIFRRIGAKVPNTKSDTELVLDRENQSPRAAPLPPSLKSIARLLKSAAPLQVFPWALLKCANTVSLRPKARSYACHILCHVCLDARIHTVADVLIAVQDALEAIICHFVDNPKLIQGVGSPQLEDEAHFLIASQLGSLLPHLLYSITHPLLQRDLVCALPAKSPLTAYFRRHLALSFLLHPSTLTSPLTDGEVPALVHNLLHTSPSFRINKETHYHHLAARMAVLDIAIGPGLLVVPYQPLVSPAPSQAGSSPLLAPTPASDEVREFNEVTSALAQHIKLLGNSIMEAGAVADLTILDAKDSVERLCARLEHAVRIGGKKSVDVFGGDEDGKQLKVTDVFRRAAMARKGAPASGIFDNAEDGDTAVAAQVQIEAAT